VEHSSPDYTGLRAALDDSEVAIFVLGPSFSIQWVNTTAESYFGIKREDIVGEDKRLLINSTIKSIFERPERFATTIFDTYDDNSYVEEFECHVLPSEQRTERWLLHQSHPIENGPLAGGRIEHYTDISDRKQREQELQEERNRLEEFASVVSHDIRTPLNIAEGRLKLAQEECDTPHLDPARDAIERMERIVNDVLWLSREGRTIGSMESIVLRDIIDTTWTMVADSTDKAELRYASDNCLEHSVMADSDRLQQLLENIFQNAIEHAGTDVTVSVGVLEDGFYIEDDGPGIPENRREDVFTAGYSTRDNGTGFGLRIAEQVANGHGWTICLTTGSEGGARFEITGIDFVDS
jgi:PAS domain S-box-containing protein